MAKDFGGRVLSDGATIGDHYDTGVKDAYGAYDGVMFEESIKQGGTPNEIFDRAWAELDDGFDGWLSNTDLDPKDPRAREAYEAWERGWKAGAMPLLEEHIEEAAQRALDDHEMFYLYDSPREDEIVERFNSYEEAILELARVPVGSLFVGDANGPDYRVATVKHAEVNFDTNISRFVDAPATAADAEAWAKAIKNKFQATRVAASRNGWRRVNPITRESSMKKRNPTSTSTKSPSSTSTSTKSSPTDVRSPTSTSTEVRSPTSTSTEVRSPTSTSTEVRSPTSTSTDAYTQGNVTVTGGAGAGATTVHIHGSAQPESRRVDEAANYERSVGSAGRATALMHQTGAPRPAPVRSTMVADGSPRASSPIPLMMAAASSPRVPSPMRDMVRGNGRAQWNNPAWVTQTLAESFENLEDSKIPKEWLPRLQAVGARGETLTAQTKEYGCGNYGCVLPTLDPKIVLKVTTDDTESEFAMKLARTLVVPICTKYYAAMKIEEEHDGRPITLLWREEAKNIGEMKGAADELVADQHEAAQFAFECVLGFQAGQVESAEMMSAIEAWIDSVETMGHVTELEWLAAGIVRVYREQGIFFGDLHAGNLGKCQREGALRWVITDPGHISVVASPDGNASRAQRSGSSRGTSARS